MSLNSNNYIGTDLEWTPYTNKDALPVGEPIAFRCLDGTLMFGSCMLISNGVMLVVDGAFGFDRQDDLDTCEWASLAFVFKNQE